MFARSKSAPLRKRIPRNLLFFFTKEVSAKMEAQEIINLIELEEKFDNDEADRVQIQQLEHC